MGFEPRYLTAQSCFSLNTQNSGAWAQLPLICPHTMLLKEAQGSGPSAHLKEETDHFLSRDSQAEYSLSSLYTDKPENVSEKNAREKEMRTHMYSRTRRLSASKDSNSPPKQNPNAVFWQKLKD